MSYLGVRGGLALHRRKACRFGTQRTTSTAADPVHVLLSHNPEMTHTRTTATSWTLLSLRPSGEHAPLRRAVARHGGQLLAVSPWRLQINDTPQARDALRQALGAPIVVFTSPAAVHAAHRLLPLQRPGPAQWASVGEGTARALQACGIDAVVRPARMDSEGLLALPAFNPRCTPWAWSPRPAAAACWRRRWSSAVRGSCAQMCISVLRSGCVRRRCTRWRLRCHAA